MTRYGPYPSGSDPTKSYWVVVADDGRLSCDCRGWIIRKKDQDGNDKVRSCTHIDKESKKQSFARQDRGEFQYVVARGAELPLEAQPHVEDYADQFKTASVDGYVQPMLASELTKRPKGEPLEVSLRPYQNGEWIGEVKYDGIRVIVSKKDGKVQAWHRPKEGCIGKPHPLPAHIHKAVMDTLPDCTIDTEEIAGLTGKSYDAGRTSDSGKNQLAVFDILRFENLSLVDMPLSERRKRLEMIIPDRPDAPLFLAPQFPPTAAKIEALWKGGAEGGMIKRLDSVVVPGWRSPHWIKVKLETYVTCKLTGWEKAKNGPYSKIKGISTEGVEVSCKTKDNAMLRAFAADPQSFMWKRFVLKHYGLTPGGKYRGPTIFDHWAGEGE